MIKSTLTDVNPCRRATATASSAFCGLCRRPRNDNTSGSRDWTPSDTRLNPAPIRAFARAGVQSSGLASSVISASRRYAKPISHSSHQLVEHRRIDVTRSPTADEHGVDGPPRRFDCDLGQHRVHVASDHLVAALDHCEITIGDTPCRRTECAGTPRPNSRPHRPRTDRRRTDRPGRSPRHACRIPAGEAGDARLQIREPALFVPADPDRSGCAVSSQNVQRGLRSTLPAQE